MALPFLLLILTNVIATLAAHNGSLTFVIDQTDSMRDDISRVVNGSKAIMDVIFKSGKSPIQDMVVITFKDPEWKLRVHSSNPIEISKALQEILNVAGGGDCPEKSMTGLEEGLRESLSGSLLFLFTDDVPNDATESRMRKIKNLVQEKDIKVFIVLTVNPNCGAHKIRDFSAYYTIANYSSGQVFNLNDKSDVGKITYYIRELVKGKEDVIGTEQVPANQWSSIFFEIDAQTQYAIVSTSGKDVEIRLLDEKSNSITNFEKIVWINNVKIIKVEKPGKYIVQVYSHSDASVEIFGRTDFTFDPAFSDKPVTSFDEAVKHVYKGLKTYLWISVNEPKHIIDIKSVKIFTNDDQLIQELPLEKVYGDVYRTDLFLPPGFTFKIGVIGIDNNGKEILRMADMPVEPLNPAVKDPLTNCGPGPDQNSSDYYFLMSVLAEMEKLSALQKMQFRLEIDRALMEKTKDRCEAKA